MSEHKIDFQALTSQFAALNASRNFWMVRTMGGAYYGDFIRHNYIAIGFDEISQSSLEQLPTSLNQSKDILKTLIADRYSNISKHGYYASQILHFCREIKKNDIVVIPSSGATHVAIGIVESALYEEDSPVVDSDNICTFKKRRRVVWKVFCRRANLPPSLQLIFNSRHPVSNLNNYAPYIDSLLNDCYYKDDRMHLVLRIKTRNDVTMNDFFCINQVKVWAEQICANMGYPIEDPIVMKIQMESPGWLRLSTKSILGILAFGSLIIAISGGGISWSSDDGLKMHTDGILDAVSDFLDRQSDRELIESIKTSLDSLKIDSLKDLDPYLDILQNRREKPVDQTYAGK